MNEDEEDEYGYGEIEYNQPYNYHDWDKPDSHQDLEEQYQLSKRISKRLSKLLNEESSGKDLLISSCKKGISIFFLKDQSQRV